MLKLKLQYEGDDKKIPIALPTAWEDVSLAQFMALCALGRRCQQQGNTPAVDDFAEALCGYRFSHPLLEAGLQWLDTPMPLQEDITTLRLGGQLHTLLPDIGEDCFGAFEDIRHYLRQHEEATEQAAPYIIAIYCRSRAETYNAGRALERRAEIEQMGAIAAWGAVHYISRQIGAFLEKYKRLNNTTYTMQQVDAGINRLERWGSYALVDALAGGDLLRYRPLLLEHTAYEVYTKMLYDKDVNEYRERYEEILKNNQK